MTKIAIGSGKVGSKERIAAEEIGDGDSWDILFEKLFNPAIFLGLTEGELSASTEGALNESDRHLLKIATNDKKIPDYDIMSVNSDSVLDDVLVLEAEEDECDKYLALNGSGDIRKFFSVKEAEAYLNELPGDKVWQEETMAIEMKLPQEAFEFLSEVNDSESIAAKSIETDRGCHELIFREHNYAVDEKKMAKQILENIKQFLDLLKFKDPNNEEDGACSDIITTLLPKLKTLFDVDIQGHSIRSSSVVQWWNAPSGKRGPMKDVRFFQLNSKSNREVVQQLLESPNQTKLLDEDFEFYLGMLDDLAGCISKSQSLANRHAFGT
jgi:hypothetical protein